MAYLTMKELLEAGVHFGHQTKRWNPKMKPYIFGARNGIYIIDLQKTVRMFKNSYDFILNITSKGGSVLFVGTKKQARDAIYEEANRCEMFYVHNRWLGGMLTNFQTIRKGIDRLNYLNTIKNDGTINLFPKKERLKLEKERVKLDNNLGGIRTMGAPPDAIFIVDPKHEVIAAKEAIKLNIPIVSIVDTNCDPDLCDYIIPGNDDAIRAIRLITSRIADACIDGAKQYQEKRHADSDKKDIKILKEKKDAKKESKEQKSPKIQDSNQEATKPENEPTANVYVGDQKMEVTSPSTPIIETIKKGADNVAIDESPDDSSDDSNSVNENND